MIAPLDQLEGTVCQIKKSFCEHSFETFVSSDNRVKQSLDKLCQAIEELIQAS